MKPYGIRYLVCYHEAMCGLPADTAGYNEEWHMSIYCAESTLKEIGNEYEEVDNFDNGYINTDDLWGQRTRASLVRRYPEEFAKNIELTQFELEM